MTKDQVKNELKAFGLRLDYPGRSQTCIEAFCKLMEGRQYGTKETADVFLWFEEGWKAAQRRLE